MKPVVFFQCGETKSTPWLDAVQTWNSDSDIKGFWVNPKKPQSYLYHFHKKESKVLFTRNKGYMNDVDFIMTKPFIDPRIPDGDKVIKAIDIQYIMNWLNANEDKSLGYGTFLDLVNQPHIDIIQSSVYYSRTPWMGGHIYDVQTEKYITGDDKSDVSTVTWFYAYKVKSLPIYILVFNPSVISLSDSVEYESEICRYRVMDQHMGDMSTQFLKPKMSKNAFPLEDKWYVVKGEEFTFEVGGLSTVKLGLGETLNPDLVKVISDLNLVHLGDNKYRASFKKGQQSSYISIRFNTGNTLDWTFINSGNRLVYNITVTKHYTED
jgi:hypothetical protein